MPTILVPSPVGTLRVHEAGGAITGIDWAPRAKRTGEAPGPLLAEAARQLDAYFAGGLEAFDLPLAPAGTEFQKRVWKAMCAIPYGETLTYGELAGQAGGSARSVGTACGRNPIPVIVPCHRVIAKAGPGGYSGRGGLRTKAMLLDLESRKTRLL